MDQLKGKTVFMILYNYFNNDYSIIKIMENLEDAYDYICLQELNNNRIERIVVKVSSAPGQSASHEWQR